MKREGIQNAIGYFLLVLPTALLGTFYIVDPSYTFSAKEGLMIASISWLMIFVGMALIFEY